MKRTKHSKSGSTLVLVLGAVVIAAMIAVSYLIFTDNLRERAARALDQDQREIATEQAILEMEKRVRSQLLSFASYDLRTKVSPVGLSLSFNARLDGYGDTTSLSVTPMMSAADFSSLAVLGNGDPFGEAKARVQLIDVTAISTPVLDGKQRLPEVQLTASPQIAVREIPVSQFTVYSAGDSFVIKPTTFTGDVGRVFSESNITVEGGFSSSYPIVVRGQVAFQGGSIQVADSSNGSIGLSMNTDSDGSVSYDFLAAARTQLDSKFVTDDVLPVACAPSDQIYNASSSGGFNFALLKAQCDLIVTAQVSGAPNKNNGYQVIVMGKTGALYSGVLSYPHGEAGQAHDQQSVPFVAYPNKEDPTKSQVLLGFDYKRFPKGYSGSVYLVAQDPAGNLADAIVLIRGAQRLSGPLSIVSPHPIVIAGDFNAVGDAPACSIITTEDVQTRPADWGNDSLGAL